MTDDTHGTPPHDPEAEQNLEHEHTPEAETWHGGAPEDGFKDPEGEVQMGEAEEGATVFEEPDMASSDTQQSFDNEEAAEPIKKRSMLLPVMVTVGGILLLGVVAYWQFGDALHSEQQAPTVGMQMAGGRPQPSTAPMVTPKTDMVPVSNVAATTTTAGLPAQNPTVMLTAPTPSPTPPPTPTPVQVIVQAAPAAPAAPTRVVAAPETDARISALSAQVDDLKKALSDATQQLSQISTKLSSTQTAPAAQQNTLAIEERINGIEQKLMQMQQAPAAAPVATSVASSEAPVVEEPSIATPVVHHTVTHHKVVHHKAPVRTHTTRSAENVHWVLRAASPEEAWVAKNSMTSDLQPVQVGDSLAGIGKVTAIRDIDGSWVIVGTRGSIR